MTTCPTCQGRSRMTTGMVCQTCGRDYALTAGEARDRLAAIWRIHRPGEDGVCWECRALWPCPTARAGGFA